MVPSPVPRPPPLPLDDDLALVTATLAGDAIARQRLVARVHALALSECSRRRLDRPGRDVSQDVALRVVERTLARDAAALRQFALTAATTPDASFPRWLAALVATSFIDHLRAQPDAIRRDAHGVRRLELVTTTELDDDHRDRDAHPLAGIEARQLLLTATRVLTPLQQMALARWLRGDTAAEIALELHLDGAVAAQRLLHSTRERLRRALREVP